MSAPGVIVRNSGKPGRIGNPRPFEAVEQRREARRAVDEDRVGDRLDAMHMEDEALRQAGVQRRLDRRT